MPECDQSIPIIIILCTTLPYIRMKRFPVHFITAIFLICDLNFLWVFSFIFLRKWINVRFEIWFIVYHFHTMYAVACGMFFNSGKINRYIYISGAWHLKIYQVRALLTKTFPRAIHLRLCPCCGRNKSEVFFF